MKKFILKAVILGAFLVLVPTACFAEDAFTKLGRGVANTLTGWVELPKNVYDTSLEENTFTGMTLGLAKGAGMTLVRTASGIFEIATFPFPLPENYEPLLEPEYVF
jgi:putative exosortase-associated protein (TIGR04073 family)